FSFLDSFLAPARRPRLFQAWWPGGAALRISVFYAIKRRGVKKRLGYLGPTQRAQLELHQHSLVANQGAVAVILIGRAVVNREACAFVLISGADAVPGDRK